MYLLGYGVGRFWIESLRTDQLLLPGTNFPVSMVMAALLSAVAFVWILAWHIRERKRHHTNKVYM